MRCSALPLGGGAGARARETSEGHIRSCGSVCMLSGYCIDIGDRTRDHFYILLPATRIRSPSLNYHCLPYTGVRHGSFKKNRFLFLFAPTRLENWVRIASISMRAMTRGFSKFFFGKIAAVGRAGHRCQHLACGVAQPYRFYDATCSGRKMDPASGRGP